MKVYPNIALLLFLTLLVSVSAARTNGGNDLLRIQVHGKIGFIDTTGKVVIEPRFANVGAFHEGLAPAREGGLFGYIDQTGKFVIAPIYDFATEFHEGFGITYVDGKPSYIAHDGQRPFECSFEWLNPFEHGRAIVRTTGKHEGVIDRTGRLVADTIYNTIHPFENGLTIAIVNGPTPEDEQQSLIDRNGRVIRALPITQYFEDVGPNWMVIAEPAKNDTDSGYVGIYDLKGNCKRRLADRGSNYPPLHFTQGLSNIPLSPYNGYEDYKGLIDTEGHIVLSEERYVVISPFHEGHAIAMRPDGVNEIIDRKGRIVAELPSPVRLWKPDVSLLAFDHGTLIVFDGVATWRGASRCGLLDTTGKFVIPLSDDYLRRTPNPRYLCVSHNPTVESVFPSKSILHGSILDLATGKETQPFMDQDPDDELSTPDALYVELGSRVHYARYDGTIIWSGEAPRTRPDETADIDYVENAHYEHVCAREPARIVATIRDTSKNTLIQSAVKPLPISEVSITDAGVFHDEAAEAETEPVADRSCQGVALVVDPSDTVVCRSAFPSADGSDSSIRIDDKRLRITLSNCTADTLRLSSLWGRTPQGIPRPWMEALDRHGVWRPIDGGGPGYDYQKNLDLRMHPFTKFELMGPLYRGSFATKLRICVQIDDRDGSSHVLHSNEFSGSINPAQFWRRKNWGVYEYPMLETEPREPGVY
ncbi:MAG: WG repeat-containing protein [Bacteroidetes bacterium]|nr:WG repeat-containing protein [Bacteroidota bacterium]